jgi:hypothetical protein
MKGVRVAASQLPNRPNLEQYKKRAKNLVKSYTSGHPEAARRVSEHHPCLRKLSPAELQRARFTLADAQCVIAPGARFR